MAAVQALLLFKNIECKLLRETDYEPSCLTSHHVPCPYYHWLCIYSTGMQMQEAADRKEA